MLQHEHYGIPDRKLVVEQSKAKTVSQAALEKVRDAHVRMSLELQQAFGLRREEAIKMIPTIADQGDRLVLKASWTKGGKAREIPIRTPEQRIVLDRAHAMVGRRALIPLGRNYVNQLRVYEGQTIRAGLSGMHGLRHAYAQQRYLELTGWLCPGGRRPDVENAESRTEDPRHRCAA